MSLQIHKLSQENAKQAPHRQPHMCGHKLKDRAFCQAPFVMTLMIKQANNVQIKTRHHFLFTTSTASKGHMSTQTVIIPTIRDPNIIAHDVHYNKVDKISCDCSAEIITKLIT